MAEEHKAFTWQTFEGRLWLRTRAGTLYQFRRTKFGCAIKRAYVGLLD